MLHSLEGHTDRLGRIAFHPMGHHLATASFDMTWRLWDIETGTCLLEQEGHSRSVYTVAFQCDGSLAASGGLDAIGGVPYSSTVQVIFLLCRSDLGLSDWEEYFDAAGSHQEDSGARFCTQWLLSGVGERRPYLSDLGFEKEGLCV